MASKYAVRADVGHREQEIFERRAIGCFSEQRLAQDPPMLLFHGNTMKPGPGF
jgi:hypothetical protein